MRFDEASARYAEFGPFYASYVSRASRILEHCLRRMENARPNARWRARLCQCCRHDGATIQHWRSQTLAKPVARAIPSLKAGKARAAFRDFSRDAASARGSRRLAGLACRLFFEAAFFSASGWVSCLNAVRRERQDRIDAGATRRNTLRERRRTSGHHYESLLATGRSSIAVEKLDTQMNSPPSASNTVRPHPCRPESAAGENPRIGFNGLSGLCLLHPLLCPHTCCRLPGRPSIPLRP